MTIPDFLTPSQITQARHVFHKTPDHLRAREIRDKVITPNISEINRKLGQENDALYLAYACCYAFGREMY